MIVLQHEKTHIDQFRQTGRPRTAAKMLDDEIAAYGDSSQFLQGQGGAQLIAIVGTDQAFVNDEDQIMTAQQTAMQTIRTGNAADAQLAASKAGGYLPAAVKGKANDKIDDLYPTIP